MQPIPSASPFPAAFGAFFGQGLDARLQFGVRPEAQQGFGAGPIQALADGRTDVFERRVGGAGRHLPDGKIASSWVRAEAPCTPGVDVEKVKAQSETAFG